MRIISGTRRGKKLVAPAGMDVRPTADRVKEALFNILQFSLEGKRFLDLFAGSGQIGLEALSRGAAQAVFVDFSPVSLRAAERNLAATGFSEKARLVRADACAFLRNTPEAFDLAFLDPPYRKGLLEQALPLLEGVVVPGGLAVCEHPKEEDLPEEAGALKKQKTYRYGKIALTVYRVKEKA